MILLISKDVRATAYVKPNGGAREDRTPDLLRARQALSQLSYGPNNRFKRQVTGLKAVSIACAYQHVPDEPMACRVEPCPLFLAACAFVRWWVWEELNLRPHPYQGCALTN